MDATLTEIVAAIVAVGGLTGGGLKFVSDRLTARQTRIENRQAERQTALEKKQEEERTRLEAERVRHELKIEQERLRWERVMQDQLFELRREIRLQEHEIGYLRTVGQAYLRHIAALEGLMRAANINIPVLDIPAYKPPIFGDDGEILA